MEVLSDRKHVTRHRRSDTSPGFKKSKAQHQTGRRRPEHKLGAIVVFALSGSNSGRLRLRILSPLFNTLRPAGLLNLWPCAVKCCQKKKRISVAVGRYD
ncbi:hypothetical protein GWI33_007459 [Rhynchophorus ferrugineus]|uniref:Uncharacterized protein n=1 Tax=Rhynchophorus ferrugineus TaxID=354439 RepID=A0A834IHR9_RHYFE|nr:hypothetical protein GWI33_007459 [Rhynchophorus ferrugineus]